MPVHPSEILGTRDPMFTVRLIVKLLRYMMANRKPTGNGRCHEAAGCISRHRHLLFVLWSWVCEGRRKGVRGPHSVARLFCPHSRTIFFYDGLSPQGSSRIRHRVRRFGHCGSDRALGRVLRSLFTRVVVCWTGKCLSIA